jgi:hypothetical protein
MIQRRIMMEPCGLARVASREDDLCPFRFCGKPLMLQLTTS